MAHEYIEEFNSFLAGEISAAETYRMALENVENTEVRQALAACEASHTFRANFLQERVLEMGGKPAAGSGIWGSFARVMQGQANSELSAVAALEQSEAERLVQYEAQQEFVPPAVQEVLSGNLLPAQHLTHLAMSTLLKQLEPTH